MARIFVFPNPVDEVSARLVAAGVVLMVVVTLAFAQWWILVPLVYGFVARVAAGPRFSPLGLIVTRLIRPRLVIAPRLVAGPPKRFAQSMGVAFSGAAALLAALGLTGAATVALAMLLVAASLEAFVGLCLGCKVFAGLMRLGLIPEETCEACGNLESRLAA